MVPPGLAVIGGNLLVVLSATAAHAGATMLVGGRRPRFLYEATILAYLAGESYFFYVVNDINIRIAVVSLVRVPVFVHAALILFRHRRSECNAGLTLLTVILGLWALLLVPRSIGALMVEGPIREFVSLVGIQAFYFAAAGLGNVVIAVALIQIDLGRLAKVLGSAVTLKDEALETQIAHQVAIQASLRQSEADLLSILDNMTDIFYRTDEDGRVLMISHSVEPLLGYRVDQIIGNDAGDYHWDEDNRARLIQAMEERGGSVSDYEFQMRHRDGHSVWVSTSSRFYVDGAHQRRGIEGIVRVIDERKHTEQTIRESQSLIQAMLDASSDAIMLFKPDGLLLAVNGVMAERFGRNAGELTGLCLWDMFPADIARARQEAVARVVETGQAIHYLDRRGELYLDNSIYPVVGAEGRYDKVAVYSRDITAEKLAEIRIATYLEELERSNSELEQFAYVASHDLREPLRMISSYLALIERRYTGVLDKDGLEFLQYAREGATRMDHLVLDLLDFSRIQRRGEPIIAMLAPEALRQALRHLAPAIAEAGAEVLFPEEGEAPRIMGDPDQMTRLFQNLVGNAIKYRSADRPVRVNVSWSRQGAEWEFHISDNGIGIEPQYFERIFGIFQRLHTRDKYEGTGIGLAICRKIVERHSGRIWLESVPGQGTVFSFALPAA
ncbi:MAG: PAS domain S-box protein [Magnetospirillum sp.]|nr:PAS domain S-box protein [Magnetospirillum sp.]